MPDQKAPPNLLTLKQLDLKCLTALNEVEEMLSQTHKIEPIPKPSEYRTASEMKSIFDDAEARRKN